MDTNGGASADVGARGAGSLNSVDGALSSGEQLNGGLTADVNFGDSSISGSLGLNADLADIDAESDDLGGNAGVNASANAAADVDTDELDAESPLRWTLPLAPCSTASGTTATASLPTKAARR